MRSVQQVIVKLLKEIDDICRENDIEFFLSGKTASDIASDGRLGTRVRHGEILMRAQDLKKFIDAFNKQPHLNRSIEYMGNNGFFPGFYLNYIDDTTLFYSRKRLECEKKLGLYVTINVIRPENYKSKLLKACEQAWINECFASDNTGRKIEPFIRNRIVKRIERCGREKTAADLFSFFVKHYTAKSFSTYWVRNSTQKVDEGRVYSDEYIRTLRLGKREFKSLLNTDVGDAVIYNHINDKKPAVNNYDVFCDTELSYKDIDLGEYKESITKVNRRLRRIQKKHKRIIEHRKEHTDTLYRCFNRYFYGLMYEDKIKEMQNLYETGRYEELDELLLPYLKCLNKYKNVYLCEEINELIRKRYHANTDKLFSDVPQAYRKGIEIYDYNGNRIRTILGDSDARTSENTI